MPYFQITPEQVEPRKRSKLVSQLAAEMNGKPLTGSGQPVIYEETIPGTETFHVVVVWNEWEGVPAAERGDMILEAYRQFAPNKVLKITISIGATVGEAISMGLLPYEVSAVRLSEKDPPMKLLKKAMRDAGAYNVYGEPRVYCRTSKEAETMRAKLQKRVPTSHWNILHGVEAAFID